MKDYLIKLLENGATNKLNDFSNIANDSMLFHKGDTFNPYDYNRIFYEPGQFNDGEEFKYSVTVLDLTSEEATIKISYID